MVTTTFIETGPAVVHFFEAHPAGQTARTPRGLTSLCRRLFLLPVPSAVFRGTVRGHWSGLRRTAGRLAPPRLHRLTEKVSGQQPMTLDHPQTMHGHDDLLSATIATSSLEDPMPKTNPRNHYPQSNSRNQASDGHLRMERLNQEGSGMPSSRDTFDATGHLPVRLTANRFTILNNFPMRGFLWARG